MGNGVSLSFCMFSDLRAMCGRASVRFCDSFVAPHTARHIAVLTRLNTIRACVGTRRDARTSAPSMTGHRGQSILPTGVLL